LFEVGVCVGVVVQNAMRGLQQRSSKREKTLLMQIVCVRRCEPRPVLGTHSPCPVVKYREKTEHAQAQTPITYS